MNEALAQQQHRVIVPSYSQWFDRDGVNEIEKKGLPEFFSGKSRTKTPEVYRDLRDFMVDVYRMNPTEYLTITACRRNLASDVGTLVRVHQFLETWGLINYQIDPESRPSIIGPQYTGHFLITLDAPQGLKLKPVKESTLAEVKRETAETDAMAGVETQKETQKETQQEKEEEEEPSEPKPESAVATAPRNARNLVLKRSVYDTSSDAMALMEEHQRRFQALTTRQYNCFTTSDDVTKLRFHNLQSKQVVSATALKQGLFPANYTAADYIKLEQSQVDLSTWSNTELLLLLEGIEMFDNDWDQIAYHVGTRSKESCIAKFVQLPIEDEYLEKVESAKDGRFDPRAANPDTQLLAKLSQQLESAKPFDRATESGSAALKSADTHLVRLVELEMKKLELKTAKFAQLEQALDAQRRNLELERLELFADRIALNTQADAVKQLLGRAVAAPREEAASLAAQAKELASQAPRYAVKEKSEEKEDCEPVSVTEPLTYKFWSA